jgi:hypothetical protein
MQEKILVDERTAAAMLGVTPRTLAAWRQSGQKNLPYVKISSRCIRYRVVDLELFAKERLRISTSDHSARTR